MRVRAVSVGFWLLVAGSLAGCMHAVERSGEAKAPKGSRAAGGVQLGSIDKEAIRAVIREHTPDIRSCYERRLAASPTLRGKVVIKWVIQPDGSTSDAVAEDEPTTLRDPELHACMRSRIVTWKFPKPAGGGVGIITYPWIFQVEKGAVSVQGAERATVGAPSAAEVAR